MQIIAASRGSGSCFSQTSFKFVQPLGHFTVAFSVCWFDFWGVPCVWFGVGSSGWAAMLTCCPEMLFAAWGCRWSDRTGLSTPARNTKYLQQRSALAILSNERDLVFHCDTGSYKRGVNSLKSLKQTPFSSENLKAVASSKGGFPVKT